MNTKNILLASGLALVAYALWKKRKNEKVELRNEMVSVPKSSSLKITPISSNSSTYERNGIYLRYPVIMKP